MDVTNLHPTKRRNGSTQTALLVPVILLERMKKERDATLEKQQRSTTINSKSKPSFIGRLPARYRQFAKSITNNELVNSTLSDIFDIEFDNVNVTKGSTDRFVSPSRKRLDVEDWNVPVMLASPAETTLSCSGADLNTAAIIGEDIVGDPDVELGCGNAINTPEVELGPTDEPVSRTGAANNKPTRTNTNRRAPRQINNISVHFDAENNENISEDVQDNVKVININADTVFINNHFVG